MIAVNDAYPIDARIGFHGKTELPFFPHMRRFGRPYTPLDQSGALEADPEQLRREAALILSRIDSVLKRSWIDHKKEIASAIGGIVPVDMSDEAIRFLNMNPMVWQSAIRTASSLSDLVSSFGILRIEIKLVYDIELETEKIVMHLAADSSSKANAFECETQMLSWLDANLSDDDKLRIAVRVE